MDAQSSEAYPFNYHDNDSHRPKNSHLSNTFEYNQLLFFLVNNIMLIIFLLAEYILLSVSEFLSYLMNQIPHLDKLISRVHTEGGFDTSHVDPLYPDWFLVFSILEFISNSSNRIQGTYFLYSTCEENDYIVQIIYEAAQINPYLCSDNGEFDVLIDPFDHSVGLNTCISINYFPMSVFD